MKIYLTYDYELFFGSQSGSAEKCILEPTNKLRYIAKRTGAKMTFFVDVGYLKQLSAHQHILAVKTDYLAVKQQIKSLVAEGHDCQLHIHPHWEDSYHDGDKWVINVDRYKLADFNEVDIQRIVLEYQAILKDFTKKPVTKYRAGGWCLQPFSKMVDVFKKAGLTIDSTVFRYGKNITSPYYYDFENCPEKDHWQFSSDLCIEDENGPFTEFPISSYQYSVIFFWKLFLLGRLFPKKHKPIGDGFPVPSVGMRKEMLTKGKLLSASCDGYFITKVNQICNLNQNKGYSHTVIIGHPKAMTEFSLQQLEQVIQLQQIKGCKFVVFEANN
ncbi:MAG: hypothetical protein AB8B74_01695 [Crocinitomicaceae bacterium]